MTKTRVRDMIGWREPRDNEKAFVYSRGSRNIKRNYVESFRIGLLTAIIGFFLVSLVLLMENDDVKFNIFLSVLALAFVSVGVIRLNYCHLIHKTLKLFNRGEFYVMDCSVVRIGDVPDLSSVGRHKSTSDGVWVVNNYKQVSREGFRISSSMALRYKSGKGSQDVLLFKCGNHYSVLCEV